MNINKGKKVYVGLSGGVDSSVSAALLKSGGYDVTGVYIRGWYPDWTECRWRDDRRDAMRVAATLNIPFLTCDAEKEYKHYVADYLLEEYKKGRTPNPDIMCNKYIKFGVFFDWAMSQGADYVATGHYVRTNKISNLKTKNLENTQYELLRGTDRSKDQSYFLWTLTQKQLPKILFPLGEMRKKDTRALAAKYRLPTASKKDSQGVCFLEDLDMEEFLAHYVHVEKGAVLDEKNTAIGTHRGAIFYTIGQRHGFSVFNKQTDNTSHYVIQKNLEANTITVSTNKPELKEKEKGIDLTHTNWITEPNTNTEYFAQSRYRQVPKKCVLLKEKDIWRVYFTEKTEIPASGQSLVVYDGLRCLGGGVV